MHIKSQQTAHNFANTGQQGIKLTPPVTDNKADQVGSRLHGACRQFEGFMLGELLKAMQPSDSGFLRRGRAERMFINQQCEALGELLAAREPLGLARLLRETIRPGQTSRPQDANAPAQNAEVRDEN